MNLHEVNWRFALYSGGLVGGVVWAVLASLVIDTQNDASAEGFTVPSHLWLLIGGTSLAILVIGAIITASGRSVTVRSAGIGLGVSALAGWVMIAWIVAQFAFGL